MLLLNHNEIKLRANGDFIFLMRNKLIMNSNTQTIWAAFYTHFITLLVTSLTTLFWQDIIRARLLLTSHTDFFMLLPQRPSLIKVCLIRALIEVSNGKSHALTTFIAPAISSQIKSHYCCSLLWDCGVTWHGLTMTRHPINTSAVIVSWTSAMISIKIILSIIKHKE